MQIKIVANVQTFNANPKAFKTINNHLAIHTDISLPGGKYSPINKRGGEKIRSWWPETLLIPA
jgi:hypothetical protein